MICKRFMIWKAQARCATVTSKPTNGCSMSQLKVAEKNVAADTNRVSSAYVPSLQRTEGQPPPIAANGGLSYMSFDRDGDAGTAPALEDGLTQIAAGEAQRRLDRIDKAPPCPPI